jgi:nitrite reductase (NADH) large subunit
VNARLSLNRQRLVVVGNGMAGMRTVEELLKLAPDAYEITVFGSEPHPNYNRILLSPVLAGEQTIDEIVLNTRAWYAEERHHAARRVDRHAHRPRTGASSRLPTASRRHTTGC